MATYTELLTLAEDAAFKLKVAEGVLDAAQTIIDTPSPTGPRREFLRLALGNPPSLAAALVWPLLVINQDLTAAQIGSATAVQTRDAVLSAADRMFNG